MVWRPCDILTLSCCRIWRIRNDSHIIYNTILWNKERKENVIIIVVVVTTYYITFCLKSIMHDASITMDLPIADTSARTDSGGSLTRPRWAGWLLADTHTVKQVDVIGLNQNSHVLFVEPDILITVVCPLTSLGFPQAETPGRTAEGGIPLPGTDGQRLRHLASESCWRVQRCMSAAECTDRPQGVLEHSPVPLWSSTGQEPGTRMLYLPIVETPGTTSRSRFCEHNVGGGSFIYMRFLR